MSYGLMFWEHRSLWNWQLIERNHVTGPSLVGLSSRTLHVLGRFFSTASYCLYCKHIWSPMTALAKRALPWLYLTGWASHFEKSVFSRQCKGGNRWHLKIYIFSDFSYRFRSPFWMLGSLKGLSLAEECSQVQVLKTCHCEALVMSMVKLWNMTLSFNPVALRHSSEQFCGTFWACKARRQSHTPGH